MVRDYLVAWKVYKAENMIQDKSSPVSQHTPNWPVAAYPDSVGRVRTEFRFFYVLPSRTIEIWA